MEGEEQSAELEQLGVDVFDRTQLEEGILRGFEETAARQEQVQTRKRIERNLREVQDSLRYVLLAGFCVRVCRGRHTRVAL